MIIFNNHIQGRPMWKKQGRIFSCCGSSFVENPEFSGNSNFLGINGKFLGGGGTFSQFFPSARAFEVFLIISQHFVAMARWRDKIEHCT